MSAAQATRVDRVLELARSLAGASPIGSDPVDLVERLGGFTVDGWQRQVLQSASRRQLLLCCRQSGKSTTAAVLALHKALTCPDSLSLLVSPSLRQSSELFRKVASLLRRVDPAPLRLEDNRLSFQLANGARVVSLPSSEATIRGFSAPDLIVEDEAARVSDELHQAVRPMLAISIGTLILLSTPWGMRGHFHDLWENGGPGWERTRITAHDCPRISPEFLSQERESLPDLVFRSEYLVEFVDTVDQVFASEQIAAALDPELTPLWEVA